jgi:hypothetical protein
MRIVAHSVAPMNVFRAIRAGRDRQLFPFAAILALLVFPSVRAATDLDDFMRQVLTRRDDNWKRLQQYILDEHEQIEIRGPAQQPIYGERRQYTWFVRDGFFVRSPIKVNGVTVTEADRQKYEGEFLRRTKERDSRQSSGDGRQASGDGQQSSGESVDGLLRQVREPQFISLAYFLRFKFEQGTYALVGRETLDGRETLRIEYYPVNLYSQRQRRRMARDHDPADPRDAEINRMLNKVALVTLWIDPASHQILKYTFDNVDFDFLPGRWIVRLDSVQASMTMGQPFPGVWLPQNLEFKAAAEMAPGRFDVRYAVEYRDYRQADVKSKVHVGPVR